MRMSMVVRMLVVIQVTFIVMVVSGMSAVGVVMVVVMPVAMAVAVMRMPKSKHTDQVNSQTEDTDNEKFA